MTPQVTDADTLFHEERTDLPTIEVDRPARADELPTSRFRRIRLVPWRKALMIGGAALAVLAAVIWATAGGSPGNPPNQSVRSRSSGGAGITAGPVIHGSAGQSGSAGGSVATGSSAGAGGATALAPQASNPTASGATASGLPNEVPTVSSKVVKTGTLQLQVAAGSVVSTVGRLSSEVSGLGGFVASSTESTGSSASGDVTLRVPVANFNALIGDAQKLGKTLQLTSAGQDVTSQYVDLQARIDSLQTARTQFEQILARAQSIGDILSVESQISDLQTQIEQLQGQFQVLDNQATYSTLTVQIDEATKPAPAPPKPRARSGISKAWSHAIHSFAHGAESILAASGGIALFVVTLAVVLLVGRVAWMGIRRRAGQPPAADRA
jgi:hypothetical protein